MADATSIKGGKFRVLLGSGSGPVVYAAPCGFRNKSMTFTKGTEEFTLPDCTNPDKVPWLGRDAISLSMAISGEGVLAAESVQTWLDAWENPDSIPVKVEIEFPAILITWTGFMHVTTLTTGHPTELGRVTNQVEMASDGTMTRVVTP